MIFRATRSTAGRIHGIAIRPNFQTNEGIQRFWGVVTAGESRNWLLHVQLPNAACFSFEGKRLLDVSKIPPGLVFTSLLRLLCTTGQGDGASSGRVNRVCMYVSLLCTFCMDVAIRRASAEWCCHEYFRKQVM